MRRLLRLFVACLVLGLGAPLSAQIEPTATPETVVAGEPSGATLRDAGEVFVEANTAYEEGDYATAIRGYRELIERQIGDGRLHFNLGNAYLRDGELGRAIAEFRRGRNQQPRDEDLRANLAFARQSTRDAIAPPEPSPVLSTLLFWHYRLSERELAVLVLGLNILFWGLAIVRLFQRQSEILTWILLAVLGALVIAMGSLAGHHLLSRPVAVVVPQEIDAYTAPDSESVVRFKLHAGTELRVRDERQGWLRIVLPDDQQGWIEAVWAEVVDG